MRLVIKQHRPRQRAFAMLGVCVLVIGAAAVAFHFGHWRSITSSMGVTNSKGGIADHYFELKQENEDLMEARAKLQRTVEIDQHARVDYQKTVSELQTEIAELKLELAFYRDALSSTEVDKGPHVRGFRIRDFGGSGRYQYRLVLTHVNKDDKVASGLVYVEIRGTSGGIDKNLRLSDVAEPNSGNLAFKFKHFRRMEGVLQLPDDFAPEKVHVAVIEDGRNRSTFHDTYDWAKLTN